MNALLAGLGSTAVTVLAFVVLLGIVITVHEWGHFTVARFFGVRVLRFSIGFGKALWSRTARDGTEYVIAAIPLGGYVKMLDEREAEVPAEQLPLAFNRKPVAQRFAIVAAGPLINLLLAVVVYWALFVAGGTRMAPVVGSVEAGSPAAVAGILAGDEIVAIDGAPIRSWDDLPLRTVAYIGDSGDIRIALRRGAAGIEYTINLPVHDFMHGHESDNPLSALGLRPWLPPYPVVVDKVLPEIELPVPGGAPQKVPGPGRLAGLQAGDRIVRIDGQPIDNVFAWMDAVRAAPGRTLDMEIERGGKTLHVPLLPAARTQDGRTTGFAGVGTGVAGKANFRFPEDWPAEYRREVRYGPLAAVREAVRDTWDRSVLTLGFIGKLLRGALSTDSIGGPLTIAHGAGVTFSIGPGAFFDFLALVSITIGIFNLLPVPVLDGGHLFFYAVEAVIRRPVPERVQVLATQVGLFLLLALMALALFNDSMRYLLGD